MTAEIRIPDSATKAAITAIDGVRSWKSTADYKRQIVERAIQAALPLILNPVCYRMHQPNHSSEWMSGNAPPFESKHPAWSIEQAYTIKETE